MNLEQILNSVTEVNANTSYWFMRTHYGDLFDSFYNDNYISIGWDYITLYELANQEESFVKAKIANTEKINIATTSGKIKVSTIYNKLKTFNSLNIGDVVIIPSRNSEELAFGTILGPTTEIITARNQLKRRQIQWHLRKEIVDLGPIFYRVKSNQHAISNVDQYSIYIDREIGNLFKKNDRIHYVLNITKSDDINYFALNKLLDDLYKLLYEINLTFGFNESLDDLSIKVNIQSKGPLELIKSGRSLAVLAFLLNSISCNTLEQQTDPRISELINNNREIIDSTSLNIDTLEIDNNKLRKPFNNGH